MSLRQDLKSKNFVITAELNPGRTYSADILINNAKKLTGLVSAINITDNSGAAMKMSSLVASFLMQSQTGIEAIWQITCRDRNRLAIQSDLLGAYALGLRNILPLKGDAPIAPLTVEKCFDINTDQLIETCIKLSKGKDFDDKEVKEPFIDFCIGAAAHPGMEDLNVQKISMQKRLDMGAEFFQTQICFDKKQIDSFANLIGPDLVSKTLLGLTPIKTLKQAEFMNKNIFGVSVPAEIMTRIAAATSDEDAAKIGLDIAVELTNEIKKIGFRGLHVMAIGQESRLDEIVKAIS
jgi:methylenetetrahydrofolate reductase (NADPH)